MQSFQDGEVGERADVVVGQIQAIILVLRN